MDETVVQRDPSHVTAPAPWTVRTFAAVLVDVTPAGFGFDEFPIVGSLTELEAYGVAVATLGEPARWAIDDVDDWLGSLQARGIGPGLVLAAVESGRTVPGLPERVVTVTGSGTAVSEVLAVQRDRHRRGRPPSVDEDPAWVLRLSEAHGLEQVHETLTALADGHVGTRGDREEQTHRTHPLVVVAGVYDRRQDGEALLPGPLWTRLEPRNRRVGLTRVLDLRTGVLVHEYDDARSVRFVSLARPGTVALRFEGPGDDIDPGPPLRAPAGVTATLDTADEAAVMTVQGRSGGITAAAVQDDARADGLRTVERVAVVRGDPDRAPPGEDVRAALDEVAAVGFDRLLAEHRAAWAARWDTAAVSIDGDPDTQLAVRLSLFHLISAVADRGEATVGARGLSGHAYAGHVFWDTDVYVLPVLAATHPPAARAILEYRLRRLPAARSAAHQAGADGLRFPWESAATGDDVTPPFWRGPDGTLVPIRNGEHEEHIVADVAWAAVHYATWSGDDAFLSGAGSELVLGAARYFSSRLRATADGALHLYGVIGPDEYHEIVDDNAYTNVMARWVLRNAASLLADGNAAQRKQAAFWREQADQIVDGLDPASGIYEQFAGYHHLEPVLATSIAARPFAADLYLGRDRLAGTQIIKQADVLMLHHLVPEEVAPDSLRPNLQHYLPRTSHGSSLSPAVHASLLARAGRPDEALDLLRLAARIDLDDLTGTATGGLHLAAQGGVWHALVFGFLGARPSSEALTLDPVDLPSTWHALRLRLVYHGATLEVTLAHDRLTLTADSPVPVGLARAGPAATDAAATFTRVGARWRRDP